ncbi:thioredoxin reductase [Flavobacterium suaedae]|uniref:Thioredoxin reductase n=1 Tax=Flavobacterium suaedae TaxID=1767027 RepID=A0ABQ1K7D4_9FLAO|nr:NAD(P)/FAD-dependent oxidoreductase [Flavobacterium suaedae]GGB85947.1 thioredoxin reductase [Flavobacterium suaedae]
MKSKHFEVIIIGGSYAGLSAGMALGRASRETLIIDSGKPCNRYTPHSHNFLTQDGETPQKIAQTGKDQVLKYPSITFQQGKVTDVVRNENGFTVITESEDSFTAKKVIFALGIKDILPEIENITECWGKTIIHCPYCHGYEFKGEKTAIIANGEAAYHYASLLKQWTNDLTIFSNGKGNFTDEQLLKLKKHTIPVVEKRIKQVEHVNGALQKIILEDGDIHKYNVAYARPMAEQHNDIPKKLGLLDENGYIAVNEMQKTNIEGIYAAGDCTTPLRTVSTAIASGTKAGAMLNGDLCQEIF